MDFITGPEAKITGRGGCVKVKGSGSSNQSRIRAESGQTDSSTEKENEPKRPASNVYRDSKSPLYCMPSLILHHTLYWPPCLPKPHIYYYCSSGVLQDGTIFPDLGAQFGVHIAAALASFLDDRFTMV